MDVQKDILATIDMSYNTLDRIQSWKATLSAGYEGATIGSARVSKHSLKDERRELTHAQSDGLLRVIVDLVLRFEQWHRIYRIHAAIPTSMEGRNKDYSLTFWE